MMEQRRVAILESTGRLGKLAVDLAANNDLFKIEILSSQSEATLLIEQAIKVKPDAVVIGDEAQYQKVNDQLWEHDIKVYAGDAAVAQVCEGNNIDLVVNAITGLAGIKATITALNHHKLVLSGFKDAIVAGGKFIMEAIRSSRGALLPVDHRLTPLFRLLNNQKAEGVSKILLAYPETDKTASDPTSAYQVCTDMIASHFYFGFSKDQIQIQTDTEGYCQCGILLQDGVTLYHAGDIDASVHLNNAMHFPMPGNSSTENSGFKNIILNAPDNYIETAKRIAGKIISKTDAERGWVLDVAYKAGTQLLKGNKLAPSEFWNFIQGATASHTEEVNSIEELLESHSLLVDQILSSRSSTTHSIQ